MQSNHRPSAFSLIEISIVILIIGILVAGITQSSRLISQAKLSSAKSLTLSSPVASISGLSFWIETTSESSFQTPELDNDATITAWNDINPQTTIKASMTVSGTPKYKNNIINGLPAVCFNDVNNCGTGSGTTNYFSSADFPNIITNSTVFAVVKLPSTLAAQAILSKRDITQGFAAANTTNIQLSTPNTTGGGWKYCDGSTQSTNAGNCNYSATTSTVAASTSYVVSVVYNFGSANTGNTGTGISFFQNGAGVGQLDTDTGTTPSVVSSPLLIGRASVSVPGASYFKGHIGEIIIFDRALKKDERQAVEDYLGKKWGIAMTVATF